MNTKVLIAEDNDDIRGVFAQLLNEVGYITVTARDGAEAVLQVQEHLPAVIVMDLLMPLVSGVEAAKELRRTPQLRHIPIIAQTANPEIALGLPRLFDAVLAKPFTPDDLILCVQNMLAKTALQEELCRETA